jgi:hypothetical protein
MSEKDRQRERERDKETKKKERQKESETVMKNHDFAKKKSVEQNHRQ